MITVIVMMSLMRIIYEIMYVDDFEAGGNLHDENGLIGEKQEEEDMDGWCFIGEIQLLRRWVAFQYVG